MLFRHPGVTLRNSVEKLLGPGLDVRADGGYIVVPPSVHASGRQYKWLRPLEELADMPFWLLAALQGQGRRPETTANGEEIKEGSRNAALTSLAGSMRRRGMNASEILAALRAINDRRCAPPLADDELAGIAESVGRYAPAADGRTRTDVGNAELFLEMHADRLRYVRALKSWYVFTGEWWQQDRTGEPDRAARETARHLFEQAGAIEDPGARTAAAKHALQTHSDGRLRAMLNIVSSDRAIAVTPEDFDRDSWLLACPNGTLDLRTGELRQHDPADFISLATSVRFDQAARCPTWERFLLDVFSEDTELVRYMQRACGYTLTGDTREHCFFLLHGSGANGKTTFLEISRQLLGDLATTASFDSFTRSRRDGGSPRNDLARLFRARMVLAAESGEGRSLDEAIVKSVTGGDRIAARFLFGEFFEFEPEFKLWLATNHRPRISGGDEAIWRRVRLIPFTVSFRGREDKTLRARLESELPGILAWALQGCLEWQEHGLGDPPAVVRATSEYREAEDVVGAFLTERCDFGDGYSVPASELHEAYARFCEELGENPKAASAFGKEITQRGIALNRTKRSRVRLGIRLRVTGDGDDGSSPNSSRDQSSTGDFPESASPPVTRHRDDEATPTTLDEAIDALNRDRGERS